MNVPEITPIELKKELAGPSAPYLLDVRELHESEICSLPNSTLIPIGEITKRFSEVPKEKDIVVYCRSGARSADVTRFLTQQGFPNVRNLAGGILRWSDDVDSNVPKY